MDDHLNNLTNSKTDFEMEPRWPAMVALAAVGGLYYALPPALTLGPRWLLIAVITVLTIPNLLLIRQGMLRISQIFGYLSSLVVTISLLISLTLLVRALPSHVEQPSALLRSAIALWLTNVIVFAVWYWRLDAGGPRGREVSPGHAKGSFLFPQMLIPDALRGSMCANEWSPTFVDYLFLAFNTSAALSPTDTAVLSRWAKCLMMVQSIISLTVVALLAARAVNIL